MSSKPLLSEERVQDSSDDESSGSEVDITPKDRSESTKKGPNSKSAARKSAINGLSNTDSEESNDESDATDTSSTSSTSSISTGSKRKAAQTSQNRTGSPSKKAKTEPVHSQSKSAGVNSHDLSNVKRVESTKYTPPQGYTANKVQSSDTSAEVQGLLRDLDGKQVWHISAPSSFPISKLESLNVQAALRGESILQYKGTTYTMTREDTNDAGLLTPKPNGDYIHTAPVARNFKIIGTTNPGGRSGSEVSKDNEATQQDDNVASLKVNTFFATRPGQKKVPRKQPENLKARYVPYGVVKELSRNGYEKEDSVSEQDVAMKDVSPHRPMTDSSEVHMQAMPKSSKKEKTKKIDSSQTSVNESPSKRKKENHVASSQGETESSQKKKRKDKKREVA